MRVKIYLLIYVNILCYRISCSQSQYVLEGLPCVDKNSNSPGECRFYRNCEIARILYERRRIRPTICGYTISQTVVCCPTENQSEQKSLSQKKCEEYAEKVSTKVEALALNSDEVLSYNAGIECRITNNPLIVGGEEASIGEFPHMAALGWLNARNLYEFQCGGSLISENFVLTAAHCTFRRIDRSAPRIVRIGDHDLKSDDEESSPQDIDIGEIILHPQYKGTSHYNDIALLRLATFARFNIFTRPACLWQASLENNKNVVATGWGQLNSGPISETSNSLQKVTIKVISNENCKSVTEYQHNRKLPNGIIASQMCAGVPEGGKDTCQGDSGGPLQFTLKNRCIYYIAGITSFGVSCAKEGIPGIYTRVSEYIPWIEKIVWSNG